MNETPIDLSPLDPLRDPEFEARVSAIVHSARVEQRVAVVDYLSRWTRPALAAAAIIAALAVVPLIRGSERAGASTAEILGVPPGLVAIATSSSPPGIADLAEALNVEDSHGR